MCGAGVVSMSGFRYGPVTEPVSAALTIACDVGNWIYITLRPWSLKFLFSRDFCEHRPALPALVPDQ
jgi:hypothetical protein